MGLVGCERIVGAPPCVPYFCVSLFVHLTVPCLIWLLLFVVIAGLITQVDEDGNQVNVGPPTETSSLPENHSLCASIIRSLCCISYNEIYQNESIALLLEDQRAPMKGKKCLVLDLDETLVHSSFIAIPEADFKIEVSLDGKDFVIYVVKRPGVEEFLTELSKHYELVLFTASVEKYAQKVTQLIDPNTVIEAMLYREHCTFHGGNFVKDLNRLNRDLRHCIIVDNSPISYQFHPENAIGIGTFLTNKSDRELLYCKEFLMNIKDSEDVRVELKSYAKFLQNKFAEDYGKR